MPRFEPFVGVRYNPGLVRLDDVVAPPYDVVSEEERVALAGRSPYNAVHVELARAEAGADPYAAAAYRFDEWLARGVLEADDGPAFYVYRMGYHDVEGRPRQTSGVIGALELAVPGEGDVLPHEHTMRKPRDDRLNLLRACRANLSPIWGLSLTPGLSALCEPTGPPVARCTDDHGVHHRLWPVTRPGIVAAITEAVAASPVVIADGHHRYETALAYRSEAPGSRSGGSRSGGDEDLIMTYVVELAEDQLEVRPIHRVLTGLPDAFDVAAALAERFDAVEAGPVADGILRNMAEQEALGLVVGTRSWLLRPRENKPGGDGAADAGAAAGADDGDADRLDRALQALPAHSVAYQHELSEVLGLAAKGDVQAAVLLRPVTVPQIAEAARARRRMPPKSTFFHPKPRTGLVFRRLAG